MQVINADIWVLTESHVHVGPGDGFTCIARSSRNGADDQDEAWVTIWSRVGGDSVSTADADRTAAIEVIVGQAKRMLVYGTVLPWLGSRWGRHAAAGGVAFAEALKAQAADWHQLRGARPGVAFCLAGDLNQDLLPSGHYYGSRANRSALRATLERAGLECPTASPNDFVRRHDGAAAGIDHICFSRDLRSEADGARVWPTSSQRGAALSDHYGVSIAVAASTCAELDERSMEARCGRIVFASLAS